MGFGIITIVHAVLALLLIIQLGLTGYIVDVTNGPWHDPPSSFSFLLFCTIWSILVLLYLALTPRFLPRAYHTLVALGLLCLTTLFWFAGAIAIAVRVGDWNCGGWSSCHTAKAATAFAFFIFAIFAGLTVMEGLAFRRGGGPGATADGRAKPYPGA